MAKRKWDAKEYGSGWSAKQIADDMTDMEQQGWGVFKISETNDRYEISRYPSEDLGLNDGDHISASCMTRVWYVSPTRTSKS